VLLEAPNSDHVSVLTSFFLGTKLQNLLKVLDLSNLKELLNLPNLTDLQNLPYLFGRVDKSVF
jgi:hypothetical protein